MLIDLNYDELEVLLVALVLRQEEILSIPMDKREALTRYEEQYTWELSEKLNNAQRQWEEQGVDEIEWMMEKLSTLQTGKREKRIIRIAKKLGLKAR